MAELRHYNAFISYRHLDPDAYVAEKIQKLLENYRPPKGAGEKERIEYVFLDRAELPTSKSLDQSLRDALFSSDYLIIILSEHYKESFWCMEEVRAFKEHHGGKVDRILPVLVSGEPGDVLPEEICFEEYMETAPDGTLRKVRKELEPLCCDVRADTKKERDRKLKTEFLRLAAPMLGCGYDDLYQRHRRQERRRQFVLTAGAFTILTGILIVVLIAYHKVSVSERRYRESLLTSYTKTGMERSQQFNGNEAIAYYAKVLREDPQNTLAMQGALIELQKQGWIYRVDDTDAEAAGEKNSAEAAEADAESSGDENSAGWVDPPSPQITADEETISVVMPDGAAYEMLSPLKVSTYLNDPRDYLKDYVYKPSVLPLANEGGTAFWVYFGGYLYLYEPAGSPDSTGITFCTRSREFDLAKVFAEEYQNYNLGLTADMYLSPSGKMVAVRSDQGFAMMDAAKIEIMHAWSPGPFAWQAFLFSPKEDLYAVFRLASTDFGNNGPIVEIYDMDGKKKETSEKDTRYDYVGSDFSEDGSKIMWARTNRISILNSSDASNASAQLVLDEPIVAAAMKPDGCIWTKTQSGEVKKYRVVYFDASPKGQELAGLMETITREEELDLSERTALSEKLNRPIIAYCRYPGGFAVSATGGTVFIFRDGEDEPYKVIEADFKGAINQIALDGDRLLAIDIMNDLGDSVMEIWDYEQNVHISNIDEEYCSYGLQFEDDGKLIYRRYAPYFGWDTVKGWVMHAPAPDEAAVQMLESISSYDLDENLIPKIKDPVYTGTLGNWEQLLKKDDH